MFNLGQRVWWVEDEREAGKNVRVRVKEAGFLSSRYNGDTLAVVMPGGGVVFLPNRPQLFTKPEDATTHAFGVAVRLVKNFAYQIVEVTDNAGRLHTFPAQDLTFTASN